MESSLPLVSLACWAEGDADALQRFHSALFPVVRALENAYRFDIAYIGADHDAGALERVQSLAQLDPRIRVQESINGGCDGSSAAKV